MSLRLSPPRHHLVLMGTGGDNFIYFNHKNSFVGSRSLQTWLMVRGKEWGKESSKFGTQVIRRAVSSPLSRARGIIVSAEGGRADSHWKILQKFLDIFSWEPALSTLNSQERVMWMMLSKMSECQTKAGNQAHSLTLSLNLFLHAEQLLFSWLCWKVTFSHSLTLHSGKARGIRNFCRQFFESV